MVFAIEEINRDSSFLPNVTLGFRIFDTCETVSRALLLTMQFLGGHQQAIPNFRCRHMPPQAGLIAEAGITESRAIAGLLHLYRYPQISYFATGPVTIDGIQFPSFFRSVPSHKLQALSLARLVIHFAWTWVGLLAANSEYGNQGIETVREEIVKEKVCIAFSHLLPKLTDLRGTELVAEAIVKSRARVIVIFCGSDALPLLIQLYDWGVAGKVWLCSEAMSHITVFRNLKALRMLDGALSTSPRKEQVPGLRDFLLHLHPSRTPEDLFIHEFWSKVFNCQWNVSSVMQGNVPYYCTGKESLRNGTNSFSNMTGFGLAFNVHNAVYALGHALHDMAQEEPGRLKTLVNTAQAGTHEFGPWKMLPYLRKLHFKNKVGEEVSFDEHGDPPALFDVLNLHSPSAKVIKFVQVGRIASGPSQAEEVEVNVSAIMWAGGRTEIPISVCTPSCSMGYRKSHRSDMATCCFDCVPCANGDISNQTDSSVCSRCPEDQWPDVGQTRCVPKKELFLPFHEPLGASLASASVCGSFLPVLILALFLARRETPLVRANGRELSYLLLAGLALSFLCCLLFLRRPSHRACLLRQVLFGMTFALCLSCILAKTLMVVAAFRATSPGSRTRLWLSPRMPRAVILLGCVPQILLCVAWLVASPPAPERDSRSVPHAITLLCGEGSPAAFWAMLAYLGLLAGLSLTGAFLARNLPDAFNEARLICFSLLGCLGVWLAFVPAYLTSRERYAAATEAFAILGSSLALLSGMFLPKCYILLFRPELNTRKLLMRTAERSRI
ncbi:extracellular calcium-sensing receptor-like [Elgaria multicarinata webbii]|uniref:extracellular calcium-sensing receptor-like n=1 Tax=Elgaria multicarinata webbii TaxID=159646 RepID=UPI002FCD0EA4